MESTYTITRIAKSLVTVRRNGAPEVLFKGTLKEARALVARWNVTANRGRLQAKYWKLGL